ncbi:MAG: hypothetical protein JO270_21675, partial [Acidobacteriaceae bacterium]|nr:hypothetical protein [Acidobacteriaceae bacterium]
DRALLTLYFFEDNSYRDIALSRGVSKEQVGKEIKRIRETLRAKLVALLKAPNMKFLPETDRDLLMLRYFDDPPKTYREIAAMLKMTEADVEGRMNQIFERLRGEFDADGAA